MYNMTERKEFLKRKKKDNMAYAYNVFLLLGGIGLFLYGINFMSQSLEQALGDRLREILEKLTKHSVSALLVGAGVTAVIQSSGATMVMAVGFVNAQIMELAQALYIMLGAAVGTTATAQIIAFDFDPWAPLILFLGMVLFLFIKKRSIRKIGGIVLGFGMLFTGIYIMGEAVTRLDLGVTIDKFLTQFTNPLLSLLFGFVLTFIIQSSSAAVGLLQVLAASGASGAFDLKGVAFMILGMNIGAIAPVVLSSLGGSKASRRASFAETLSKCLSVLFFIALMLIFPGITALIENLSPADVSRQIANFHLIFNVVSAVLLFPLVKPLAKFLMKKMPDDPEEELAARKLLYVSQNLSTKPAILLSQSKKEILRYAKLCSDNFYLANEAFFERSEDKAEQVFEMEKNLNFLEHEIDGYLAKVFAQRSLRPEDGSHIAIMFKVTDDLERIADYGENIAEYVQIMLERGSYFTDEAWEELNIMSSETSKMIAIAIEAYKDNDREKLNQVRVFEDKIDEMKDRYIENHVARMHKGECIGSNGVIFTDIITALERCADHAMNIAEAMLGADADIKEINTTI